MRLSNEGVYIITGGAGALANAVAGVFREAGARLALVDVEEAAVRERAEALGALPIVADLTSPAAAGRMVAETKSRYGGVDGLIHTAGAFTMASAHESDMALYDRMFDLNMRTLFCATRAVLPIFLEQRDGFVAGISTNLVWSGAGGAGMSLYAAAKGAVTLFLRSLERELRAQGIRVALVYPLSSIDTPANRRAMPDADPEGWVDPVEIANALLFASTRGRRGRLVELPIAVAR